MIKLNSVGIKNISFYHYSLFLNHLTDNAKFPKKFLFFSLKYLPKVIVKKPFKPDFSTSRKFFMNCLEEEEARMGYEKLEKDSAIVAYELAMNKIAVDEKRIKSPLLFIATKNDKSSLPIISKKMAEKYNAECKIYEGCHWIFKDWQPIAEGIQDFILNLY